MFKFELGQKVKDIVTDFTGVVVARTEYLNKCVRYGIQPTELKEGVPADWVYLDEGQLEAVADDTDEVRQVYKNSKSSGGPRPDAPMR